MSKYPTKEEILSEEMKFKKETLEEIHEWKDEFYVNGQWHVVDKNDAITKLLNCLGLIYKKPAEINIGEHEPMYDKENRTIYLNGSKPSIVSALHEFAHHLYGSSELTACRWSVWLFKKSFPNSYEKLIWDGHMLKKK